MDLPFLVPSVIKMNQPLKHESNNKTLSSVILIFNGFVSLLIMQKKCE